MWQPFIRGWLGRLHRDSVPCLLPGTAKLLHVPLRDFYDGYQFFCETGQGRKELTAFLARLKPGDVLYDIGGFRGVYSAASKLKLGNEIEIHAFEPLTENNRAITRICELNSFTNVKVVPEAVGAGETVSGAVSSSDGMLRFGDSRPAVAVKMHSISLDDYIQRGFASPSIMKIDVEGYEWAVLSGARECLERCRPRLWLELHPGFLQGQGKSWKELLDWLRSIGYTIDFFWDYNLPAAKIAFHVWCV